MNIKSLVCCLTLITLGVGYPAPKHYLIETEDETLEEDLKLLGDAVDPATMGKVVEKGSEDVMDAIEGEKTYGEMVEKGKEDVKLLGETVDAAKMKHIYDVRRQLARHEHGADYINFKYQFG